jgi:hypothetical protein
MPAHRTGYSQLANVVYMLVPVPDTSNQARRSQEEAKSEHDTGRSSTLGDLLSSPTSAVPVCLLSLSANPNRFPMSSADNVTRKRRESCISPGPRGSALLASADFRAEMGRRTSISWWNIPAELLVLCFTISACKGVRLEGDE